MRPQRPGFRSVPVPSVAVMPVVTMMPVVPVMAMVAMVAVVVPPVEAPGQHRRRGQSEQIEQDRAGLHRWSLKSVRCTHMTPRKAQSSLALTSLGIYPTPS